jgi:hypothetical protein
MGMQNRRSKSVFRSAASTAFQISGAVRVFAPSFPSLIVSSLDLKQRWLGLSEQFFWFDKWIPCRGDENDGPA